MISIGFKKEIKRDFSVKGLRDFNFETIIIDSDRASLETIRYINEIKRCWELVNNLENARLLVWTWGYALRICNIVILIVAINTSKSNS